MAKYMGKSEGMRMESMEAMGMNRAFWPPLGSENSSSNFELWAMGWWKAKPKRQYVATPAITFPLPCDHS